MSLISDGAALS